MNANQGLARRAVMAYCVGALFIALMATIATTVIEAQSSDDPQAATPSAAKSLAPESADTKPDSEANPEAVAESSTEVTAPDKQPLAADSKSKLTPKKSGKTPETPDKKVVKDSKAEQEPAKVVDPHVRSLDGVNPELAKALRRRGSLVLQNTTLKEALFAINEIWKVNIVVAQNVNGTVDATFKDTPLYEILDNILTVNGYGYRISGQTLTVGAKQDTGLNPLFETAIIELEAANPKEVFEFVKHKLSHDGEMKELATSQSLMVTDFPERIVAVRESAKKFDEIVMTRKGIKPGSKKPKNPNDVVDTEPGTKPPADTNPNAPAKPVVLDPKDMRVAQIVLKNAKVQQVLQSVETMRSRDGKITPLNAENKLVVVDYPDKIEAIEKFIEEFESTSHEVKREQFQLKYKKVATVAETLRTMLSTEGKMTPFEAENRIMIVDYPKNLADVRQLLSELDNENAAVTVQQFSPKHVKVNSLAETVQTMLSKEGKFSMVEVENSLIVIDYPNVIERVQELVDKMDREERGTKVAQFTMQFVRPSSLEQSIRSLMTKDGKITVNDVANQLTVEDYPYAVTKIEQLVKQSDVDGTMPQLFKFRPQYIEAALVKETVTNLLTRDGKVSTIDGENQVIVVDYPWNLDRVRKALHEMDTIRPQVRITVLIYDMSMEDTLKFGINWQSNVKGSGGTKAFKIDSIQSAVPTVAGGAASTTPAGVVTFSSLTQALDLSSIINAMSTSKNSRLLADPNLTVVDRRKGTIEVKQKIPIQQLTQTGGGGAASGGAIGTTSFVEAGIKMEVTPRISSDRTIEMSVKPEYSRLVGYTPGPPAQPIIESRIAETTVWVAERQTLVIGGLRQRSEVSETRGLPYLKDCKKFNINKLFSYQETEFRESELVVFINPEIVEPTYAGRDREQVISGFAYPKLDGIPIPEEHSSGYCPPAMQSSEPMPADATQDPEKLPTPKADSSAANRQPASKSKMTTAPSKQFNDGHGETWGRTAQDRNKILSQQEVLYGEKPTTNSAKVVAANQPTRRGPPPVSVAPLPTRSEPVEVARGSFAPQSQQPNKPATTDTQSSRQKPTAPPIQEQPAIRSATLPPPVRIERLPQVSEVYRGPQPNQPESATNKSSNVAATSNQNPAVQLSTGTISNVKMVERNRAQYSGEPKIRVSDAHGFSNPSYR